MSLIQKKPFRIGRAEREQRDDRIFVVATEDTNAPEQYFNHLNPRFSRVRVVPLSTPKNSGESSAYHVVQRLQEAFEQAQDRGDIQDGDEFWVLIDTDHRTRGNHLRNTTSALAHARRVGFDVAASNPCFELWLLLHHIDVPPRAELGQCAAIEDELGRVCGGYNKSKLRPADFPLEKVSDAIRRARQLELNPDDPVGWWPEGMGTRVYRLLERILQVRSSR